MNETKYMQTDGSWSGLGYPKSPCTIGNSGCGEVAIANLLIEMEQYANYTPATIQPYCKQYAAPNCDGTYWSGIPTMMKHYGLTDVKECATMPALWKELEKGSRVAVYLMGSRKGGSKKVVWTSGGHIVCSVGYKVENGLHKVYMKDSYSNSSLRNGWISYEENMAGDVLKVWVGKLSGTPTPPPKPGQLVVDGIGGEKTIITAQKVFGTHQSGIISGQVEVQHQFYPSVTAVDFDKGSGSPLVKAIQKWCGAEQDGIWGKGTSACMQKKLRDLGFFENPKETIDGYFGVKSMKAFQKFLNTKIDPQPTPEPTPTPDPTPTPTPTVIEHYTGAYPNPKKYLEYGDKGTEVTKLQNYIDWMFDGEFFKKCGKADGNYGKNTLEWCKKMQKKLGFSDKESNGEVGQKTIAKMKAYGKVVPAPTPEPTPTPTPTPSGDYKVIDISYVQKNVDFNKVKADGIGGVIIRCGFRGYETAKLQEDSQYQTHIKNAHKAGLPVGVYFFTQAINEKEGREEADYAISLVQKMGIPLSYPLGIDTEYVTKEDKDDPEPRANGISKAKRTEAIKGFCERCLERGYTPMIYASLLWFDEKLDMSKLPYDIWCAQWGSKCDYKGSVVMWQYSSNGSVSGISGRVDMNHCYIQPTPNPPTPTPEPEPEPEPEKKKYTGELPTFPAKISVSKASVLASKANEFAYADSPSKAKYPSGQPKAAYKEGLNKAYPDRSGWGKAPKAGASCDVFVGTCIRCAGIDPKYPRGLSQSYTEKCGHFTKVSKSDVKDGDVIFLSNHVCIAYGGKVKEASLGDCYPETTNALKKRINASTAIFRAKGSATIERNYIQKGDTGEAVTELQNYLNWYTNGEFFKECGDADGIFGPNTDRYTKAMQADFFGQAEADGLVGPKTVAEMAKVER